MVETRVDREGKGTVLNWLANTLHLPDISPRSLWSKVSASLERPTERQWISPGVGDWVLVYSVSGTESPPAPIEKWAKADSLFRRIREDGRFNKKPTGNTHEVTVVFIWMAETSVPIKDELELDTPIGARGAPFAKTAREHACMRARK